MIIQILATRLNSLIVGASEIISKYQEAEIALRKFEIFNDLPAEPNLDHLRSGTSESIPIRLSHICSRHPNGNVALENISIELSHCGLIALVGVSGSGKSTLANTLLGIYGFSSGDIHYYGVDISTLNIRSVRKNFSVTDQDNYIFSGTLRENLCCGQKIDDNSILHALERVGLKSLVETLPQQLDYYIDENGRALSGGQKQRICLARALLKGNKLYIFDEPTSALDGEASAGIVKNLAELSSDNLIICITHNPKIMKKSDKIILMSNGSIIAIGNHFELMNSRPEYRNMYSIAQNNS